jgi:short-subunit dehydrogenase
MKKAIIIGASSGIGKELARVLSGRNYTVGLAARRLDLLTELQKEIPAKTHTKMIDISQPTEAMRLLRELIEEMRGTDIIIICSAICIYNPDLIWENEINTINVDIVGVTATVNVAFNYFCEKGSGHIVGISSFKALRGGGSSPAYNASKAFLSNYLEGLRINSAKLGKNIIVTDIRPGFVDKSMTVRKKSLFVAPVNKVALQICKAIEENESIAYVPKRYKIIAYVMQNMPFCIYSRL